MGSQKIFFFFFFFTNFLHSICGQNQKLSLTNEEIIDIAKIAFGSSFSKLKSYEFKSFKGNKTGYLGLYGQLKLTGQLENGENLDSSLFVKSLPVENVEFIKEYKLFETESFFTQKLSWNCIKILT